MQVFRELNMCSLDVEDKKNIGLWHGMVVKGSLLC